MHKKIGIILLVLFLTLAQLQPIKASDLASTNELKVNSVLTQWTLDEPTNTLYAISETGKNLFFINSTTMNIEKTLTLNGCPTDIIKDNGNLYISLDNIHQIIIVDMVSRTISETLYTSSDPYRIVKDGNKIYYTELNNWSGIHEYDLTTNIEQVLVNSYLNQPDIAINPNDHILYIGETGYSGSDLIYYSISQDKIIGKSNYDHGSGFAFPARNTLFDGTNVYFAGRDFKLDDPTIFYGDFGNSENVIYVNKGLVYTSKSIYNKDTHVKLGDYSSNMTLVEASDTTLYIYNKDNGTITRFNDSNKLIDSSNVISLISGNATPIQDVTQSTPVSGNTSILQMNSKLIQWELDESSNTLYGISKDDKALFFVNSKSLNLEKVLTFKCKPTDIIKDNGKLYIALDDSNQIAVVDMTSRTITEILYTSSDPYRIEKDGDKIYYTERDQWCKIYEFSLMTNTDKTITVSDLLYQPDIALNPIDHILYIGESGLSGSNDMYYYSTISNTVVSKTNYNNGDSFVYPGRYTLFDGERVYYAGYDFDKLDATRILGRYGEDIIFAKYGCVCSKTSIYDRESHECLVNYGIDINLYEVSDQVVTYLYSEEANAIVRVDPNSMSSLVTFDSQGGSEVDWILTDSNTTITAPNPPTRAGYFFVGWYKDPQCINAWDFAKDLVTEDTILYARWTTKEDLNRDGKIDILDLAQIAKQYNITNGQNGWNAMYDLNNDGIVDIYDLVLISKSYCATTIK